MAPSENIYFGRVNVSRAAVAQLNGATLRGSLNVSGEGVNTAPGVVYLTPP